MSSFNFFFTFLEGNYQVYQNTFHTAVNFDCFLGIKIVIVELVGWLVSFLFLPFLPSPDKYKKVTR